MDMGFVQGALSSAQLRKIRKPIIERRRRERINRCLDQIKSLVLKALNQDESKYEKMDKADILEMAVRHLMDSQHRPLPAGAYNTGYSRCASEVKDFLQQLPASNTEDVQQRLLGHLNHGPPRASSTPAGICRPRPVLAQSLSDGEHKVTAVRHSASLDEDDSCLNCSTVSSTSTVSSSSPLSPACCRRRHDSSRSEDLCTSVPDCSVSTTELHSHAHSAFRQVASAQAAAAAAAAAAAGTSVDYSGVDSDEDYSSPHRPQGQLPYQGSSPVWRPW